MPTTSKRGLPYPGQSDPVDVAGDIQSLAQAVENSIQSGTATIPFAGTDTESVNVTFPTPFVSAPNVTVTARNVGINCSVSTPSATGVTIYGRRVEDAATQSTSVVVEWIAVGKVS